MKKKKEIKFWDAHVGVQTRRHAADLLRTLLLSNQAVWLLVQHWATISGNVQSAVYEQSKTPSTVTPAIGCKNAATSKCRATQEIAWLQLSEGKPDQSEVLKRDWHIHFDPPSLISLIALFMRTTQGSGDEVGWHGSVTLIPQLLTKLLKNVGNT